MNRDAKANLSICPDCGSKVRPDRLEGHRRKVHGRRAKTTKKPTTQVKHSYNSEISSLSKKVAEESHQAYLKGRLAGALYSKNHPQRHRRGGKSSKKIKRGSWPTPEILQNGNPLLLYSGAFEMNRGKH